jgi:hypothetical protein
VIIRTKNIPEKLLSRYGEFHTDFKTVEKKIVKETK